MDVLTFHSDTLQSLDLVESEGMNEEESSAHYFHGVGVFDKIRQISHPSWHQLARLAHQGLGDFITSPV